MAAMRPGVRPGEEARARASAAGARVRRRDVGGTVTPAAENWEKKGEERREGVATDRVGQQSAMSWRRAACKWLSTEKDGGRAATGAAPSAPTAPRGGARCSRHFRRRGAHNHTQQREIGCAEAAKTPATKPPPRVSTHTHPRHVPPRRGRRRRRRAAASPARAWRPRQPTRPRRPPLPPPTLSTRRSAVPQKGQEKDGGKEQERGETRGKGATSALEGATWGRMRLGEGGGGGGAVSPWEWPPPAKRSHQWCVSRVCSPGNPEGAWRQGLAAAAATPPASCGWVVPSGAAAATPSTVGHHWLPPRGSPFHLNRQTGRIASHRPALPPPPPTPANAAPSPPHLPCTPSTPPPRPPQTKRTVAAARTASRK
ncbi:hypothetical protein I4F81_012547 [Pyropia yezoensis]|uniref:Uncharacterized protein n=1 Tax=Pyropia yezoensis TaxID=2788 RepID=A0ACC3CIZ6_PYRYE|nr:hypothetical protein I4F81_012547 [Neopyropia yezoensis]